MRGVAIVTGGGRRLGREISLMLAQEGYDIALHFNASKEAAEQTQERIISIGRGCLIIQGDLSNTSFYEKLIHTAYEKLGPLSLLINNASIFEKISFKETTDVLFNKNMDVHVRAPFFLSQYFSKLSLQGAIVNLLDSRVSRYQTGHFAYALTKKTLLSLTLLLAKELAPRIRVNGICPGPILPPVNTGEDNLKRIAKKTPMQRPGKVSDILAAVKYLCQSTYVNGEILYVDGGERLI
ncbi:MAG: SDR family oxidoreductase [Nitrospiria bacterium]